MKPTDTVTGNTWSHEIADDGAFVRAATTFRQRVSREPGARHPPQSGRYHLYVSLACPWAHRTLIVRALKGLEDAISVDVVHPHLTPTGWSFDTGFPGTTGDRAGGHRLLQHVYRTAVPEYQGTITVPVLWDKLERTIVNNESAEIVRILNAEFNEFSREPGLDLYPGELRSAIDEVNAWIYPMINNGVYRCGFARSQAAYDKAVDDLFRGLDRVEAILATTDYLCGSHLSEADVRLFTTLIRFDAVYHTHFKCNRRQIAQYPATHSYLARLYRIPAVGQTVNLDHIRFHYYYSHRHINPAGIVPRGPDVLRLLAQPGVDDGSGVAITRQSHARS